jgi:hypothetical protein
MEIPAQLEVELKPRVGSYPGVAGVYLQLNLLVAGKMVANLPLGLTGADGRLSIPRATLQAIVDKDIARRGPAVRQAYLSPGLVGQIGVIGGKHFTALFTTGVDRTFDAQVQGWLTQASNEQLASEWVGMNLTEKPVTVVVPAVPNGGVNSEKIEQHARSLRAAALAVCAMGAVSVVGSTPQVRLATFILPVTVAWLVFEVWWRWRHLGLITSAAGAA